MNNIPPVVTLKDKKSKEFIHKLLTHLMGTAKPCTGGKRVTFTNKQWDEFKRIYPDLLK